MPAGLLTLAVGATLGQAVVAGVTATLPLASIVAPLPSNAVGHGSAGLAAPVCPTVGNCVATGWYTTSSAGQQGLIEGLAHGEWTPVEAPIPAGATETTLSSLACPALGTCFAVGSTHTADGLQGLIETLSGGAWVATEAPLPAGAGATPNAVLYDISCPSRASCFATGYYNDAAGETVGLIETLSGGTWSAAAAAMPTGAAAAFVHTITCPTPTWCVASGVFASSQGAGVFADVLAGGTWTVSVLPLAGGSIRNYFSNGVLSASCPAAAACTLVGTYDTVAGNSAGLIETLSGGSWAVTTAPLPAGALAGGAGLASVTCTSATDCVAVGHYQPANGSLWAISAGLVERYSGTTWTPTGAPLPAGTKRYQESGLNSVVCLTADDCLAAGQFASSNDSSISAPMQGLLESGLPSIWSPQGVGSVVSAPAGTPGSDLFALACPTGRYCVIVGATNRPNDDGAVIATVPRILLSPATAASGATVKVQLYGFTASGDVVVHWRSVTGRTLATAVSDASGAAGASFVVPTVGAGTYRVYAVEPGIATVTASLKVS